MVNSLPTVIFGADGWGYGTTTMLLATAKHLAGRARRVFVPIGDTVNLAGPEHFDKTMPAESVSMSPTGDLAVEFGRASCVVSAMNSALTWRAHDYGVPSVLIEGLGWMWTEPGGGSFFGDGTAQLPAPSTARYVLERFIGVDEKVERWKKTSWGESIDCEVVGPVLETEGHLWRPDGQILVSMGGMESWLITDRSRNAYIDLVVGSVLDAIPETYGHRRILFAAGGWAATRIARLTSEAGRRDCVARTLRHAEFLADLARSDLCITTAGMRTTLEAFSIGVPVIFLPAQIVSHELLLELLSHESLCAPNVSWRSRGKLGDVSQLPQEADGCAAINVVLENAVGDGEVAVLAARIRSEAQDTEGVTYRRSEFVRSLGTDGAVHIADLIADIAHRGA
jgi:hypothetical protein